MSSRRELQADQPVVGQPDEDPDREQHDDGDHGDQHGGFVPQVMAGTLSTGRSAIFAVMDAVAVTREFAAGRGLELSEGGRVRALTPALLAGSERVSRCGPRAS